METEKNNESVLTEIIEDVTKTRNRWQESGRRTYWPKYLRDKIRDAIGYGVKASQLSKLSGIAKQTLQRWSEQKAKGKILNKNFKELCIVNDECMATLKITGKRYELTGLSVEDACEILRKGVL
jgi:hypothetical protein